MSNMQVPVGDRLRPEGTRDPYGVGRAREKLHVAYDWLEAKLATPGRLAMRSPWRTAPPRPRYSTPTGSRRSADAAEACGLSRAASGASRSSPARSTKAGLTVITSRSARPTATKRRPRTSAAAVGLDHFAQAPFVRAVAAVLVGMIAPHQAANSAGGAREARCPRPAQAPTARAARRVVKRDGMRLAVELESGSRSRRADRRNRSTRAAGRRRWRRTCGSAGPNRRAAIAPSLISSGLMPLKKLYFALCSRTWSRHRNRQLPGPSKLAGWSGALNSPGAPHPGTAQCALRPFDPAMHP